MSTSHHGPGSLSCSFCGKSQRDVRKLIAGPMVFICDACVRLALETLAAAPAGPPPKAPPECGFCGKAMAKTFEGVGTRICEECLGLCSELIAEEV